MKLFSQLFQNLDRTNSTNEKVKLPRQYFSVAPDEDKIWALALFTDRRPPRQIKTAQMQEWAAEVAAIPFWLFRESYSSVGDLGETISLLVSDDKNENVVEEKALAEWFNYFQQ